MNKKSFGLAIKILTSNFNTTLDPKNKKDKAHVQFIFDILEKEGFTDQDFEEVVMKIIKKEDSLFGAKIPPIKWFLKYSGKQELDPKEQAEIETERIINTASYPCPVLFDNQFTNSAVGSYGGIGKVYFDVYDDFNCNRKSRHWVKRELVNIWLSCHADGKTSNKPSYPAIYSKSAPISFVGDKAKCLELLDSSTKLLEEPKNDKMNKIFSKIIKKVE